MSINLISNVYCYKNKMVIGADSELLVKLKDDMKYFKSVTTKLKNSVVVMGRKTWFSIPAKQRPLTDRVNLILTNDKSLLKSTKVPDKSSLVSGQHYFITMAQLDKIMALKIYNIFVIGGGKIYDMFIDNIQIDNLYITEMYKCEYLTRHLNETNNHVSISCIPDKYCITGMSDLQIDIPTGITFRFLEYSKSEKKSSEREYLKLLENTITNGNTRPDRTGTGTVSVFGAQARFDISKYIPIVTTKSVPWKQCIEELLWFLRGDTDAKILEEKGVKIWSGNTSREFLDSQGLSRYNEGILGAGYGWQWRHFGAKYSQTLADTSKIDPGLIGGFDQIEYIINELKNNPYSRRIMLSAWNPPDFKHTALQPCFVSGTSVLSYSGYKNIETVTTNDMLYTHNGVYNKVLQVHKSSYTGNLIRITTSGSTEPIVCTETHPFLVKDKIYLKKRGCMESWGMSLCTSPVIYSDEYYIEAKDIDPEKHVLCLSNSYQKRVYNNMLGNDTLKWMFLGYYLINGYMSEDGFCIKEDKAFTRFKDFTRLMNLSSVNIIGDKQLYFCNDQEWVEFLRKFGLYHKTIPSWVQYCDTTNIRAMLDGIFYTTNPVVSSKNCVYGIQKLLYGIRQASIIHKDSDLVYSIKKTRDNVYITDDIILCPIVKTVSYHTIDETVYNFEVERDNTYTVENVCVHNCHYSAQFYVEEDSVGTKHLSCHYVMRSNDLFLGAPWNILSYATLVYIIAAKTGMKPKELIFSGSDVHIYSNHIPQVSIQLERKVRAQCVLKVSDITTKDFSAMNVSDFELIGYFPDEPIRGKMAI
jgi:dihydrofolate reductase/thymidylate synthase